MQGLFSRTQIVGLDGGERIVIQFRVQPLDIECFRKARHAYGTVVPEVTQLHDEELETYGLSIYAMTYVLGRCWSHTQSTVVSRAKIARSLGQILAQGPVEGDSTDVVDHYILPGLRQFRENVDTSTERLKSHVDRLIAACPGLKKLPLYTSHHDLNEMNVLIGDDHEVSGIVDWECARDLPFGMALHRITDTIVANNSQGELVIPRGSREAETAFWDAVLSIAPAIVLENLEDVQNALHVGALVFAIKEKHLEGPNPSIDFLGGVLTYRLPQLRGDGESFAKEYISR